MTARFAVAVVTITCTVVVASCAPHATKATTSAAAAPASAGVHDMAGMSEHDMAAMGSHSSTELAFLFPDGDDKGWSKIENGSQHNMAPAEVADFLLELGVDPTPSDSDHMTALH